jgi:hypothetical protein
MHFSISSKLLLRIASWLSLLCLVLVAEAVVTGRTSRAADECIAKPTGAAPQGQHWYYRVDRATKQQCWYLAAEGAKIRAPARQAASAERTPAPKPAGIARTSAPKSVVQPRAEETVDEALIDGKADDVAEKDPPTFASIDWRALPTSTFSTAGETLLPNVERLVPQSTDDVRAKSPTAAPGSEVDAEEPPTLGIGFLLAVLGSALGLAGIIVYALVKLAASPSNLRDLVAVKPKPARKQSAAKPRPASRGPYPAATVPPRMHPSTQPDLRDMDVEASVRRLLHELLRRQRELAGTEIPLERPAVSYARSVNHRPISSARMPD